jgi:hypothetical protein
MKSHERPMNPTPAGKPHVTCLLTPTSHGTFPIHTGHGKEIGPTQAARSFSGGAAKSAATSKGGLTIHTGHGTEYGQESSRG